MPVLFLRSYRTHYCELHNMSLLPTTVQHGNSAFRDTFTLYARSAEASVIPQNSGALVTVLAYVTAVTVTATRPQLLTGDPGGAGQRGTQRRPKRAARVTPARRVRRVSGRQQGTWGGRAVERRAWRLGWRRAKRVCVCGRVTHVCVCGRVFSLGRQARAMHMRGICTRRETGAFKTGAFKTGAFKTGAFVVRRTRQGRQKPLQGRCAEGTRKGTSHNRPEPTHIRGRRRNGPARMPATRYGRAEKFGAGNNVARPFPSAGGGRSCSFRSRTTPAQPTGGRPWTAAGHSSHTDGDRPRPNVSNGLPQDMSSSTGGGAR